MALTIASNPPPAPMGSRPLGRCTRAGCIWCGREPNLSEVLADPIVQALMRSDGVDSEQLAAILHRARGIAENRKTPPR